jgi:hypothetical protein
MDLQVLHSELVNDPLNFQYSIKTAQECADMMNTQDQKKSKSQMITFRGLYEARNLGPTMASSVLAKIRSQSGTDQIMYDVEKMLYSERGMGVGESSAQAMVDFYTTGGLFTTQEANALKAIGISYQSRAAALGLSEVTESDVVEARAMEV